MKIQGPLDQGPARARAGVGSKVGDFSDGLSDLFIKWLIKSDFDFLAESYSRRAKKERSWKIGSGAEKL